MKREPTADAWGVTNSADNATIAEKDTVPNMRYSPSLLLRAGALLAGYLVVYIALDWVSYVYALRPFNITPWNPPPGISLALLLVYGLRWSPALFVASFVSEFAVRGTAAPLGFSVLGSALIAAAYTALAWALLRVARFDSRFERLRDVTWFSACVAIGTLALALAYVWLVLAGGFITTRPLPDYVLRFWIGDMIGIIVTTPLLLVYRNRYEFGRITRTQMLEIGAQIACIVFSLWIVFGLQPANAPKFFYLLFMPLIWIAMRHGIHGTVAANALVQVGLIAGARLAGNEASLVLELQFRMLALAVTGLFLGMAVTQWRRTQNSLMAREDELSTIVRTAPDGIVALDERECIASLNAEAEKIFRASSAALLGRPIVELIPELPNPPRALHGAEMAALRADGSRFPAELSIAEAGSGGRKGHICIVRDVSRRKEMEEQLRDRQIELERTLRLAATSELASALAHELNQPLSAISSYVRACRLMLSGPHYDHARLLKTMDKVVNEVNRTGEVVHRLREFFRSGTVHRERVKVSDLIWGGFEASLTRLERHGIILRVEGADALPDLMVDKVQMEIVIHNLVSNSIDAVKARDRREIRISAALSGENEVAILVADSGPGLNPEIAGHLFEPFTSSKSGGMGLGLAISRTIIEAHGGRIEPVASSSGAVFRVTLPLAPTCHEISEIK